MVRKLAMVAGLAAVFAAGSARAATPFGGDDTGFIPPSKDALKCESSVSKDVSGFIKTVAKCHDSRAKGKLADDTAEDACENAAATKYDLKFAKVASLCATAAPCTNWPAVRDLARGLLDGNNGSVYCQSPSGAFLN